MDDPYNEAQRILPIAWLNTQVGDVVDVERLTNIESFAYTSPLRHVVPTIGCEIEVKWSAMFPDVAEEYFGTPDSFGNYPIKYEQLDMSRRQSLNEICDGLDVIWKPRYQQTADAGIPSRPDAYWEFAHDPTYSWQTLAAETGLLMQTDLIPDQFEHSLHVTLGGISKKGAGVCLLLAGIELMHVSSERIRAAVMPGKFGRSLAWAQKGTDGVLHRRPGEILLGFGEAAELRTLTANNAEHTSNVLQAAQMLGSILLAYRNRQIDSSPDVQELSKFWPVFRKSLNDLWMARGLPIRSWGTPRLHPKEWNTWADSLELRNAPGTLEFETVNQIDDIVKTVHAIVSE